MDNILKNLKLIFKNFKLSPTKALSNSYQTTTSNETSLVLILLLAVITGLGNLLSIKYLPISIMNTVDKSLSKYNLGGLGGYFKDNYKPDLTKYFMIGVGLFLIALFICAIISYAARTSLFKTKENFSTILKVTAISLMPATILLVISNIMISFSIILYLVFLISAVAAFVIYFYSHLNNITQVSNNTICFVCSIGFLLVLFIIFKLNVNTDIANTLLKPFGNFLNDGLRNILN